MRIAYLTIDEVNQHLAQHLAGTLGARLEVLWPQDGLPDGSFDAVVYDLDCLPYPERQDVLSRLLSGSVSHPTLVHSYHLGDEHIERLASHGVAVLRSISSRLIGWLATVKEGWQHKGETA
jgi:hypothetical protein